MVHVAHEPKEHVSKYVAKKVNKDGLIDYTDAEHKTWHELITRQTRIVQDHACEEYLRGLELLNMSVDHIPQCQEMNAVLGKATGWSVFPVEALIPVDYFFTLLANRQFPAASFIRIPEELDYLQEPDIFHEFFGHCPMLTDPVYANFMQMYGKIALSASPEDRDLLGRLYWFTVEFGLINSSKGPLCYGGGILSSKTETIYAVESDIPKRLPFNKGLDALRTPYRIDIVQPVYYVIDRFDELYQMINNDIFGLIAKARALGEFEPLFKS